MMATASVSSAFHQERTENGQSSISPNFSNYPKGALLSITLENFMIHDRLRLEFGSSCNLIMGPNGNGKSSILCGLVIGLGGDPKKILKRGRKLEHFIKSTSKEARIKIDFLNCEGQKACIERHLVKEWNSARYGPLHEWKMNGRPVSKAMIDTAVSNIGVKLDSLCQVLPQEKVGDFTKLEPKDLLKETEKTIGDGYLYDCHVGLIDKQRKIQEIEKSLEKKQEQLSNAESVHARLHAQRVAHEDTERAINDMKLMKDYLPTLRVKQYALKKSKLNHIDRKLSEELKEREEGLQQAYSEKHLFDKKIKSLRHKTKEKRKIVDTIDEKIDRVHSSLRKGSRKLDEHSTELANCQKKMEERDNLIARLRRELEIHKQKLENTSSNEELQAERNQLRQEKMEAASLEEDSLTEKGQEKERLKELEDSLQNSKRLREQIFESRKRQEQKLWHISFRSTAVDSAMSGIKFVQNNEWNGPVYGPVCMRVTPKTYRARIGLDNALTLIQKMTFVCFDGDDFRKLCDQNFAGPADRQKTKKLCVYKCITSTGQPQRVINDEIFNRLKGAGFTDTLDNLIECPDIVRTYLLEHCKVNKVFIGEEGASLGSEVAALIPPGYRVLTDSELLEKKTGYVSGAAMTSHRPLQPDGNSLFHTGPDKQRLNEIDDEIHKKEGKLQQQHCSYQAACKKCEDISQKLKAIQKRLDKNQRAKMERKKIVEDSQCVARELEHIEQESVEDIIANKGGAAQGALQCNQHIEAGQNELKALLQERKESVKELLVYKIFTGSIAGTVDALQLYVQELKDLKSIKIEEVNKVRNKISETHEMLKKAESRLGYDGPPQTWMNEREDVCRRYHVDAEAEDAANRLENVIRSLQADIDANDARTDIVERYNRKREEIASLKQSIKNDEIKAEQLGEEMAQLWEEWNVENMIEGINDKFAHYMEDIGYNGKVELHKDARHVIENFGLVIKVSFRKDAQLQELNMRTQSGGERAVATMVFMLALQTYTKCPFRIIDEINQGMDEWNERNLLKAVFTGCADPVERRQYIILTPKLLPKLDYPQHVLVHTVYNGPEIWSAPKISFHTQIETLRKRRRIQS